MFCRRVPPVKGYNRHALFCADANLGVIVEDRDEIDVEGRGGVLVHSLNHGTELLRGREANPDRADPSATAHRKREVRRHAAKARPAQANGCLQAKRSVNRVTMLPMLLRPSDR